MRWAPLAVFTLFVAIAAAWLANDPAVRRKAYAPGSSLGTGPDGTSLARAYLEASGEHVSTLARPLAQASLPPGTVLLRIDPAGARDRPPASSSAEAAPEGGGSPDAGISEERRPQAPEGVPSAAEDAFVRAGGRLVLAIRGERAEGRARKVSPLLRGVGALETADPRTLPAGALVGAQPVFERGEAPSVARRPLGSGEIWLLAEPELLFNRNLGAADHLALLVALAGGGRPVVFDEHVHGLGDDAGVLRLLRDWGLGPALLIATLALCAAFWRRAVTVGPPADPWRDPRAESVELVDSMAALYRRALSPAEALQLYRTRLLHEIALRLGVGEKRAETILQQYAPDADPPQGRLSDSEFQARLGRLVSACERFRDERRSGRI
jgi:hypothetical protein